MEQEQKKAGLFDDLSLAQLAAGALAAVTSTFLASNIGIAGTLIGVGVGSVVSAVASQLYKKFFSVSAEKIKDLAPTHDAASTQAPNQGHGAAGRGSNASIQRSSASTQNVSASDQANAAVAQNGAASTCQTESQADIGAAETALLEAVPPHAKETHVLRGASSFEEMREASRRPLSHEVTTALPGARGKGPKRFAALSDAYAQSALEKAKGLRQRKTATARRAVVVAAVAGVVAFAGCALAINALTQGQGLGPQLPYASSTRSLLASDAVVQTGASQAEGSDEQAKTPDAGEEASSGSADASGDSASGAHPPGEGSQGSSGGSGGQEGSSSSSDSGQTEAPSAPSGGTGSAGADTGNGNASGSGGTGSDSGASAGSGSDAESHSKE